MAERIPYLLGRVARRFQYLRAFGVPRGRAAMAEIRRLASEGGEGELDLWPGQPPFRLRGTVSDINVFEQIFVHHPYPLAADPAATGLVIDAGANIGASTLFLARKFPNATVVAVEAEKSNYGILKANTDPHPNIESMHAALWNAETMLDIADPDAESWSFEVGESAEGKVPGVTVEGLLAKYGKERIDLLKLDIEGAEKEVLEDSARWMLRVDRLIVELHERKKPGCEAAFAAAMDGVDWERRLHGDNHLVERVG